MTVAQSTSKVATDPLRDFNFVVTIQPNDSGSQAVSMGFMTVSGLGHTTDVIAYRQGGWNVSVTNMPGQVLFAPLVLTRGVTLGATQPQITWFQEIFGLIQGVGNAQKTAAGQAGGINLHSDFRACVYIYVLSHPNTNGKPVEKMGIKCYNAWPYQLAYSELDAGSNQLLISQMTLCFEGFDTAIAGDKPGAQIGDMSGAQNTGTDLIHNIFHDITTAPQHLLTLAEGAATHIINTLNPFD